MEELIESLKTKEKSMRDVAIIAAAMFTKSIKHVFLFAFPVFLFVNLVTSVASREVDLTLFFTGEITYADIVAVQELFLLTAALDALFTPIASAATAAAVFGYLNMSTPTLSALSEKSIFIWWKIAPTAVLYAVAVYAGAAFIIPGIYFGAGFMFYIQAVVLTGKWGVGALAVSRNVLRGRFFKALRRLIVVLAAHGVLAFILMLITGLLPYSDSMTGAAVYSALRQTAGLYFVYFSSVWFYNWFHVAINQGEQT